jgi:YfiH family protein
VSGRLDWLEPEWPAPPFVHAAISLRAGGVSAPPWETLNLALHVGDDPAAVAENRRRLADALHLPSDPCWLTQVHGCRVADAGHEPAGCRADAAFACGPDQVCAVLTADCLPLLVTDRAGSRVAAVHAGWRGLAAGVVEAALGCFPAPAAELLVWLGPAIGPQAFEVGADVREAFVTPDPGTAECFVPARPRHWLADIYALARRRLARAGVGFVGGGGYCTVSDADLFYSYRRDGVTGRMASLVWIDSSREAL